MKYKFRNYITVFKDWEESFNAMLYKLSIIFDKADVPNGMSFQKIGLTLRKHKTRFIRKLWTLQDMLFSALLESRVREISVTSYTIW